MKVSELLSSADKWTQGKPCERNAKGEPTSWCLLGAIYFCYPGKADGIANAVRIHLFGADIHDRLVTKWNDDQARTFKDVRKVVTALGI